jgi:hypothetical protein
MYFYLIGEMPKDTVYTLFIKMEDYELGTLHLDMINKNGTPCSNQFYFSKNGWQKLLLTTTINGANRVRIYNNNGVDNKYKINKHIILVRGDHTSEEPPISAESGINSTTNPTITFTTHPFIFGKGGRL